MEVVSSADPIPTGTGAVVIDGSDAVNSQVTDAITQANTKVLGDAPAVASGNLYEQTAQALQNAVDQQTATQEFSQ
ncbi:MAG: RebB family R body protein, partial [Actinomycetia bacterium]|nr:RebB family R body protein [Actinomycetes bacterium]